MSVVDQIKEAMTKIVSVLLGIFVLIVVMVSSFAIEFFPQLLIAFLFVWILRHL